MDDIDLGQSERKLAKLFGVSRIALHRWKLAAEVPEELRERLITSGVIRTTKAMAELALALRSGSAHGPTECCPHCGGVLRDRRLVSVKAIEIVNEWVAELED
jgi:hypothetical protein